jgi:hypothetical protein
MRWVDGSGLRPQESNGRVGERRTFGGAMGLKTNASVLIGMGWPTSQA